MLQLLLTALVVLVVVGIALWILDRAPFADDVKPLVRWVVLVIAAIWLITVLLRVVHAV